LAIENLTENSDLADTAFYPACSGPGRRRFIGPLRRRMEIMRFSSIPPASTPIIRMKMENLGN